MNAIIGHDAPIATFLGAMRGPKLHHAWLLTGPRGIGKATTATMLATRLLAEAAGPPIADTRAETPEDHRIARLMLAGSHPDFLRLERVTKDGKLARGITVDQVRAMSAMFTLKPALSGGRVVLIDAIDDFEASAANALLKSLEEPPAGTIFMLISHAPGRLLPTVRSRCRVLRFGPLEDQAIDTVLQRSEPPISERERAALIPLAEGAPGRAIRFAGLDIAPLEAALMTIARTGDPTNALRTSLAQAIAAKTAQPRYEALLERAPAMVARLASGWPTHDLPKLLMAWEGVLKACDAGARQSLDPQMTVLAVAAEVAKLAPLPA